MNDVDMMFSSEQDLPLTDVILEILLLAGNDAEVSRMGRQAV